MILESGMIPKSRLGEYGWFEVTICCPIVGWGIVFTILHPQCRREDFFSGTRFRGQDTTLVKYFGWLPGATPKLGERRGKVYLLQRFRGQEVSTADQSHHSLWRFTPQQAGMHMRNAATHCYLQKGCWCFCPNTLSSVSLSIIH